MEVTNLNRYSICLVSWFFFINLAHVSLCSSFASTIIYHTLVAVAKWTESRCIYAHRTHDECVSSGNYPLHYNTICTNWNNKAICIKPKMGVGMTIIFVFRFFAFVQLSAFSFISNSSQTVDTAKLLKSQKESNHSGKKSTSKIFQKVWRVQWVLCFIWVGEWDAAYLRDTLSLYLHSIWLVCCILRIVYKIRLRDINDMVFIFDDMHFFFWCC